VAVVMLLEPGLCSAWGPEGHIAVGGIAERYLAPEARKDVRRILGSDHLYYNRIANWPDFIRGNKDYDRLFPGNHDWHYVDIDINTPEVGFALPTNGNDVADQIVHWQAELAQRTNTVERRRDAIRFLVHFVADIHQPLHCAFRDGDRGGNLLPIHSFRGAHISLDEEMARERTLNLHKVWDDYLLQEAMDGIAEEGFADSLMAGIRPEDEAAWRSGTPKQWAWESHELAVTRAYRFTDGSPLPAAADGRTINLTDANYISANAPLVREQLRKAGVRLAWLINEALSVP
jgi:hypothetical protein